MKRLRLLWLLALSLTLTLQSAPAGADSVADLYRQSYRAEATGKYGVALAAMEQIKTRTGESYFVVARLGWLSHLAGKYTAAESYYRKAVKLEPKAIEPRLGLTLPLLAQKKKLRELEKASRDVIKLDAKNAVARARLAHALYELRNYPDAAVIYRKLVEDYPANLDYKTGLGWAIARMGRVAEAKKIFKEVLAVSPDNPNAQAGMRLP